MKIEPVGNSHQLLLAGSGHAALPIRARKSMAGQYLLYPHGLSDESDHRSTMVCMGKVTKRELNQNTASVLRRITEKDDLVVTEHGEPRWRISAYLQHDSALSRLKREGRYTPPATIPTPWPDQLGGPKYSEAKIEELLDEVRGDH